LAYQGEIPIII